MEECMAIEADEAHPSGTGTESAVSRARSEVASTNRDPLVPVLVITILVIIVLTLVTVVYAMVTGVFGTGAPRTIGEYKIMSAKAAIDAGSKERQDWLNYILALTEDGQYRLAQDWIDKGTKTLKKLEISADMLYAQSTLYAAEGEPDKALKTANTALAQIKKTHAEALADWKKTGNPTEASIGLSENYYDLLLLKADIYQTKQDWKNAVKAYNEYLAEKRTAATVFAMRAAVKEKLGDKAGAKADYRQTLRFIPDNADALAGLKRIGAAQ
jgi:tetratricopeptide (TPR) repeat protein